MTSAVASPARAHSALSPSAMSSEPNGSWPKGRPLWSLAELQAWAPVERQSPSEWAEQNIVLSKDESDIDGPWRSDSAPYLAGIMDACAAYRRVIVMKGSQLGLTTAVNIVRMWRVDQDPGPALVVMATEDSAKELLEDRITPLLMKTERLRRYLTGRPRDVSLKRIRLQNMTINLGWAGSPSSLATRPCRYVDFDERDKYPVWSGKEADPVKLGEARTRTFRERACIAEFSTPTTSDTGIAKRFTECVLRLHFHVPCPHCGKYQTLNWNQMKWDKSQAPDPRSLAQVLRMNHGVWYECEHCHQRIQEKDKRSMVRRGVWAMHGVDEVHDDGSVVVRHPATTEVAFQISALYCLWSYWWDIAAEFLEALDNPPNLMAWRNNQLGEPFEQVTMTVNQSALAPLIAKNYPANIVPSWAGILLATVDSQQTHYWFVLRAWGRNFRSRLITYGRCETLDDVRRICIESTFDCDNTALSKYRPYLLGIDCGGSARTEEDASITHRVYKFAQTDPVRILPLRGHGGSDAMPVPVQMRITKYKLPTGGEFPMKYLRIDTGVYKDVLAGRIKGGMGAEGAGDRPDEWELNATVGGDYVSQMASEHKILVGQGMNRKWAWVPLVSGGIMNHLWDCEVYQCALADMLHVNTLPSGDELEEMRRHDKITSEERKGKSTWIDHPRKKGWLK